MMETHSPSRRSLLLFLGLTWSLSLLASTTASACNQTRPNIIIMLMDDMGYGDMGINGDPALETPNLDRMAHEGMHLTDHYSAAPICSPSRAALLTGRLPIRNGFYTTNIKGRNSYVPQEMTGGIYKSEILISELLAWSGYRNKIVGKWHLGHHKPEFWPLKRGFHEFYGTPNVHFGPYNDKNLPNVPLFRNEKMIGRLYENIHIDRRRQVSNLTQVYAEEAREFIKKQEVKCEPFFLYWTPDSLHAPTYRSEEWVGRSKKGSSYGDQLMEMDDAIGGILDLIRDSESLANNTFVFFTSDNGPALVSREDAGSNGGLLCGKQTTFEGGVRAPTIAWWPGRIKAGSKSVYVSSHMDLYRTIAKLAGAQMPANRTYDSNDLAPVLFEQKDVHGSVFHYRGDTLMALRHGAYKAHYWTFTTTVEETQQGLDYCPGQLVRGVTTDTLTNQTLPVLFQVVRDPAEKYPISSKKAEYKTAMKKLEEIRLEHEAKMVPGEPALNMCDRAAMNWAPVGCEELGMCLPVPPSTPYRCTWPH